jgi:hypothetical protein
MSEYQARWTSKKQAEQVKKSGAVQKGMLLDSFKGFIIVEPKGSHLGDGPLLTPQELEAELQADWCQEPRARIAEARRRLGLHQRVAVSA